MKRIVVIGAGASGMVAAITAAENYNNQVILLEKQSRVGKKLLATGNGRCNLSNSNLSLSHYHGMDRRFTEVAIKNFTAKETLKFFGKLGLLCNVSDSGRIFPYSHQAGSVVDILRFAVERSGIDLRIDCNVIDVIKVEDGFKIRVEGKDDIFADNVICSMGGAASAQLGGTSDGYRILKSLGHTCTDLYPSLVQLKTDTTYTKSLNGIKTNALVKINGKSAYGEILFTNYGVSGPVIFSVSRSVTCKKYPSWLNIDFMYEYDEKCIVDILERKRKILKDLDMSEFLTGILNKRIGQTVIRYSGLKLSKRIDTLTYSDIKYIVRCMKHFHIKVVGDMGLCNAQVTAGGINVSEFNSRTMQSKICPGLFVTGELLDVDGDCGGYNLQWAWSSGRLAGRLGENGAGNYAK